MVLQRVLSSSSSSLLSSPLLKSNYDSSLRTARLVVGYRRYPNYRRSSGSLLSTTTTTTTTTTTNTTIRKTEVAAAIRQQQQQQQQQNQRYYRTVSTTTTDTTRVIGSSLLLSSSVRDRDNLVGVATATILSIIGSGIILLSATSQQEMNPNNNNDNNEDSYPATTNNTTTSNTNLTSFLSPNFLRLLFVHPITAKPSTLCDSNPVPSNLNIIQGEEETKKNDITSAATPVVTTTTNNKDNDNNNTDYYYGLFPLRQLVKPKYEYPLWDNNWDGKEPDTTTPMSETDAKAYHRHIRKYGITKHIILIRHGQYDETYKDDTLRKLTPLGISQAHYTGQRLATMLQGFTSNNSSTTTSNDENTTSEATVKEKQNNKVLSKCNIKSIRVSCLTRAQETANIIASYLPTIPYHKEGDSNLNEGRPCHTIPPMNGPIHPKLIEIYDQQHPRIEQAYQTYFYRHSKVTKEFVVPSSLSSSPPDDDSNNNSNNTRTENNNNNNIVSTSVIATERNNTNNTTGSNINNTENHTDAEDENDDFDEKHEFEIIICHANVIRYFLCRALQLPPEAWLRYCPFNCSLTYITIRPTGSVSCRMVGDIGHLPYDHCTFSQHHGYNW